MPEPFERVVCARDGQKYKISIWDTVAVGKDRDEDDICLAYQDAELFVVAFSVVDRHRFNAIVDKWFHEIRVRAGSLNAPIVLVGTKLDKRTARVSRKLACRLEPAISREEGEMFAKKHGCVAYCECSSLSKEGLDETLWNPK